jgi:hypothetical protein
MCLILIPYRVESVPGPMDPGIYIFDSLANPEAGQVHGNLSDTKPSKHLFPATIIVA